MIYRRYTKDIHTFIRVLYYFCEVLGADYKVEYSAFSAFSPFAAEECLMAFYMAFNGEQKSSHRKKLAEKEIICLIT